MAARVPLERIRNIGIAAHIDAGKTTLTERILYATDAIYKLGEVHDGAAHMDYQVEEQSHGITITSALTKTHWNGHVIQIIDTPGHVDFTIEVERCMRVLDGVVLVLDGVRGVESQSETVWRQRERFNLPGIFFINKMDRPGADFDHAIATIGKRLRATAVPLCVPLPQQHAVVHLIERTLIQFSGEHGKTFTSEPCDEATWERVTEQHESLLLAVAEHHEELADSVLAGETPDAETLWSALADCTRRGLLFPCLGGAALRDYGVQPLLDAVVRLLPNPLQRPKARAWNSDGEALELEMRDNQPLVALAFKVQLWEGRRHVFARLYRGTLKPGDKVSYLRPDGSLHSESVARVFDVDANHKQRIDQAHAGDIVLLAGLRHATTGDTLCQADHILRMERIESQKPVLSLALEPASVEQEEKFLEVMEKLCEEDPTLSFGEDPETGQRLLSGMGELHLQILIERLHREFGLEVRSGRPAVALRETVSQTAEAQSLFQPPADPSQRRPELKARVAVVASPRKRGSGVTTHIEPRILPEGATLSAQQLQALQDGVAFALKSGPLEGAPLEDIDLAITEVELFGAASTPDALSAAVGKALHKALELAGPVLLQPIMAVDVTCPEEHLGSVLGDLQARQGVIRNTNHSGENSTVECELPLANMLGYSTELRSLTQGRGQFNSRLLRFDQA